MEGICVYVREREIPSIYAPRDQRPEKSEISSIRRSKLLEEATWYVKRRGQTPEAESSKKTKTSVL